MASFFKFLRRGLDMRLRAARVFSARRDDRSGEEMGRPLAVPMSARQGHSRRSGGHPVSR